MSRADPIPLPIPLPVVKFDGIPAAAAAAVEEFDVALPMLNVEGAARFLGPHR
jgi:hypothetical protein